MALRYPLIFAILSALLSLTNAEKYKCYECNLCPEPFTTADVEIANDCAQCGTTTTYSGNEVISSTRRCLSSCTPSDKEMFGTRMKTDCCTADLCNSASSNHHQLAFVVATSLLTLVPVFFC
ncbi:unnamed protein product [Calicophoron daubneyi]|uniref:Snake toxin/toxin-like domain-containing protein n=1 Tax=Calicophoron daubneyi TaxID=300641 RepID=A0AAV2TX26_CALDB